VVGDDLWLAVGVVVALVLTTVLAAASIAAWWVAPAAVPCLVAVSLRRTVRREAG
jgi:hypothetical protein